MPVVPRTSVIPPGGWHFVDRSGPQELLIQGSSDTDVEEKILRYRLTNGYEVGNPRQELIDSICIPHPHACVETEPVQAAALTERSPHMSRRVAAWIAPFYRSSDGVQVSAATADARAKQCAACALNVAYDQGGCGSCIDAIQRLSFVWRRGRETSEDKSLAACSVCSQHNATAVHAQLLPALSPEERNAMPDCWRKQLATPLHS